MRNIDAQLSEALERFVRRSRLLTIVAAIGASQFIWLMFGAAYAQRWAGNAVDEGGWRQVWSLSLPLAAAWLITLGLEFAFRRRRPFEKERQEPLIVKPFIRTPSFPSGHATLAFALAAAAYFYDARQLAFWLPAAAFVSLCRVAVGVHYLSDVIAGALVGVMVIWGFLQFSF